MTFRRSLAVIGGIAVGLAVVGGVDAQSVKASPNDSASGAQYTGSYRGEGDGGDVSAEVRAPGADGKYLVSVDVSGPGCFGSVEGLGVPHGQVLRLETVASGERCEMQLQPLAKGQLSITESSGCRVLHGASCSFEAVVNRVKSIAPTHPSTKASAAPQGGATKFPLVGEWSCKSSKPGGASFSTAFKFDAQGGFVYVDPQSHLIGRYQPSGGSTSVTVEQAKVNGQIVPSSMLVRIDSIVTSPGQSKFKMTLVKLGTEVANTCVTKAVAAATPAPQVDVCSINPAACASVQRNSDIRSQIQDQRCAMLRSQLSGMVGADYQLAKAGCR
ncbi:hypothetical protein [Comamonas terrae]|uniref:Secreted protein n=1 Tax=Comamonas terrae TaxID=673548 RepID=A0ABW5UHE1_9BURK|nr:hypothetical protein [Comamonas terrae]